ncbi:MAG TPA: catechol 1,2-dioxygenase [Acidimicrobiia bacterium]
MGEVVGAGLISHVPTLMFNEEQRKALNEGNEISLVPGMHRLRSEVLDRLDADTIVIFDTHWFSTVEHLISSHERRWGRFTSTELPRGMAGIPFDYPCDPELAEMAAQMGNQMGTPTYATNDPYISLFYATINLVHYLRKDERIVSVSVCQTGEPDDFLTLGAAMGAAVDRLDRRVVLLASGGMSHAFWPLKQIPKHEASDPIHIITPEARAADEDRVELMKQGRHRDLIESMDDYMEHSPEGRFGHYLMMVGAIGGEQCSARGQLFSDYENATGTGQVHIWFERPAAGWTG